MAITAQTRRGRPHKTTVDVRDIKDINVNPQDAETWFRLADRLLLLKKAGNSQADIGTAIGISSTAVARLQKSAAWPTKARNRILSCAGRFPPDLLMQLARNTFLDQGRITKDGRRRVHKSRYTLQAAVELIIEGKSPIGIHESPDKRVKKLEQLANAERSRRLDFERKIEELEKENRALKEALSLDRFNAALRENRELKLELHRIRAQPGKTSIRKPHSPDLEYRDGLIGKIFRCGVETIDWGAGLVMLNLRSGEMHDGLYDDLISANARRPIRG